MSFRIYTDESATLCVWHTLDRGIWRLWWQKGKPLSLLWRSILMQSFLYCLPKVFPPLRMGGFPIASSSSLFVLSIYSGIAQRCMPHEGTYLLFSIFFFKGGNYIFFSQLGWGNCISTISNSFLLLSSCPVNQMGLGQCSL